MNRISTLFILVCLTLMSGCEAIGDIFSAGFYTGLLVVVVILAIIIFIVVKINKK